MSKRILLASAALMSLSLPAFAADDPVVARVNGTEIHRSDVQREIDMLGPQAQQMPMQMIYPRILQQMIATKLVSTQGYAEKLQNDPDVNAKLKDAEDQLVAETYVRHAVQPRITDAKIKARYDELAAKYKPQDEVRARHILITLNKDDGADADAKAEAKAEDIIKQLKGGADFAKLAGDKSDDKGSAKQGGDLGYFPHDQMVKPFADAAFAMKVGDISDKPVKSDFGYHVIKVEDKRKSSAPPLAEVKDQIVNKLGEEETNALVKSLEAKAKIEKFNPDGSPMTAAADAGK